MGNFHIIAFIFLTSQVYLVNSGRSFSNAEIELEWLEFQSFWLIYQANSFDGAEETFTQIMEARQAHNKTYSYNPDVLLRSQQFAMEMDELELSNEAHPNPQCLKIIEPKAGVDDPRFTYKERFTQNFKLEISLGLTYPEKIYQIVEKALQVRCVRDSLNLTTRLINSDSNLEKVLLKYFPYSKSDLMEKFDTIISYGHFFPVPELHELLQALPLLLEVDTFPEAMDIVDLGILEEYIESMVDPKKRLKKAQLATELFSFPLKFIDVVIEPSIINIFELIYTENVPCLPVGHKLMVDSFKKLLQELNIKRNSLYDFSQEDLKKLYVAYLDRSWRLLLIPPWKTYQMALANLDCAEFIFCKMNKRNGIEERDQMELVHKYISIYFAARMSLKKNVSFVDLHEAINSGYKKRSCEKWTSQSCLEKKDVLEEILQVKDWFIY